MLDKSMNKLLLWHSLVIFIISYHGYYRLNFFIIQCLYRSDIAENRWTIYKLKQGKGNLYFWWLLFKE